MKNNFFCVHPFFWNETTIDHTEIACCILKNKKTDRNYLKECMLTNQVPPECAACSNVERAGTISRRIRDNNYTASKLNKSIAEIEQQCIDRPSQPILFYQIRIGQTCNATCVTCNLDASSAWANLLKSNSQILNITPSQADLIIDYQTALAIGLVGGEAFLCKTTFHIIEKLAELNPSCEVAISTNGSVSLNAKYIELCSKVNMSLQYSIDGIDRVFEYMRYPLSWEKVKPKLTNAGVTFTVSNLNILYAVESCQWFKAHDNEYSINPVTWPTHFSPSALPKKAKDKIIRILMSQNTQLAEPFAKLLETHCEQDDVNYQKFLAEVKFQDSIKKIDIKNYLPELVEMLDSCD